MTQKEIDQAKKQVPGWRTPYDQWTPEQKQLSRELYCREMINSCLCYGHPDSFYDEKIGKFAYYAQDYIKDLGEARVHEIWDEQVADFNTYAKVLRNTSTDAEGVTYNSVIWTNR